MNGRIRRIRAHLRCAYLYRARSPRLPSCSRLRKFICAYAVWSRTRSLRRQTVARSSCVVLFVCSWSAVIIQTVGAAVLCGTGDGRSKR